MRDFPKLHFNIETEAKDDIFFDHIVWILCMFCQSNVTEQWIVMPLRFAMNCQQGHMEIVTFMYNFVCTSYAFCNLSVEVIDMLTTYNKNVDWCFNVFGYVHVKNRFWTQFSSNVESIEQHFIDMFICLNYVSRSAKGIFWWVLYKKWLKSMVWYAN